MTHLHELMLSLETELPIHFVVLLRMALPFSSICVGQNPVQVSSDAGKTHGLVRYAFWQNKRRYTNKSDFAIYESCHWTCKKQKHFHLSRITNTQMFLKMFDVAGAWTYTIGNNIHTHQTKDTLICLEMTSQIIKYLS